MVITGGEVENKSSHRKIVENTEKTLALSTPTNTDKITPWLYANPVSTAILNLNLEAPNSSATSSRSQGKRDAFPQYQQNACETSKEANEVSKDQSPIKLYGVRRLYKFALFTSLILLFLNIGVTVFLL